LLLQEPLELLVLLQELGPLAHQQLAPPQELPRWHQQVPPEPQQVPPFALVKEQLVEFALKECF
jgi:hypothetical protein